MLSKTHDSMTAGKNRDDMFWQMLKDSRTKRLNTQLSNTSPKGYPRTTLQHLYFRSFGFLPFLFMQMQVYNFIRAFAFSGIVGSHNAHALRTQPSGPERHATQGQIWDRDELFHQTVTIWIYFPNPKEWTFHGTFDPCGNSQESLQPFRWKAWACDTKCCHPLSAVQCEQLHMVAM